MPVQGWVAGEDHRRDQEMEAGTGNLGRMLITSDADVTDNIDRLLGKITNYDVLASGALGALNATLELAGAGLSTVGMGISGTWVGTIVAEITTGDGVWGIIPLIDNTMGNAALATAVNGNFLLGVAGALTLRIRMSAYTSGTATIYLEGSSAPAGVFLSRSIPTGVNSIGTIGLDAGEAHVGEVGGNTITVTVTLTLTVAGAYSDGDYVGTSGVAGVIANAARAAGKGGVLESVAVIDGDLQSVAGELWLFDTAVTPPADNAAWSISDADAATVIPGGVIPLSTYYASALNSVAVATGIGLSYTCPATSLYFVWVTRGAPTYTSGKLSFRFNFMRD
jgi:hypothetical protein